MVPMCYNRVVNAAQVLRLGDVAMAEEGALRTMLARQVVLLTPPRSSYPSQLLSRQQPAPVSPLAATLMNLPASVANKRLTPWLSPLDATLTKNRGGRKLTNRKHPNAPFVSTTLLRDAHSAVLRILRTFRHRQRRGIFRTICSPVCSAVQRAFLAARASACS